MSKKKRGKQAPVAVVNPDHLCCSRVYLTGTRGRCGACGTPISGHAQSDDPPAYAAPARSKDQRALDHALAALRGKAREAGLDPDAVFTSSREGFGAAGESWLRPGRELVARFGFIGDEMFTYKDDEQAAGMRFAIHGNLPFASSLRGRR